MSLPRARFLPNGGVFRVFYLPLYRHCHTESLIGGFVVTSHWVMVMIRILSPKRHNLAVELTNRRWSRCGGVSARCMLTFPINVVNDARCSLPFGKGARVWGSLHSFPILFPHSLSLPLQLSMAICSVTQFVGFVSLDAQPHLTGALRVLPHRCDDGDFLDKSNKGNKNAPPSHP